MKTKGLKDSITASAFSRMSRPAKEVRLSGKVVVIGGGNVAIDVARTAFRVGAEDVQIFCLEGQG